MTEKFVLKDEKEEVNGNVEVKFTTTAYSIVRLDNQWYVAEIEIDPSNKLTGQWKLISEDGSKNAAIERFKINVAETLMVIS